jgi:hypothetical protein
MVRNSLPLLYWHSFVSDIPGAQRARNDVFFNEAFNNFVSWSLRINQFTHTFARPCLDRDIHEHHLLPASCVSRK